jgi:hypothetical protein
MLVSLSIIEPKASAKRTQHIWYESYFTLTQLGRKFRSAVVIAWIILQVCPECISYGFLRVLTGRAVDFLCFKVHDVEKPFGVLIPVTFIDQLLDMRFHT